MNDIITIDNLIARLAIAENLSENDSKIFITEYFGLISHALARKESVIIKGLGTFSVENDEVIFVPDETLAATANEPFEMFSPIRIEDGMEDLIAESAEKEIDKQNLIEENTVTASIAVPPIEDEKNPAEEQVMEPVKTSPDSQEAESSADSDAELGTATASDVIVEEVVEATSGKGSDTPQISDEIAEPQKKTPPPFRPSVFQGNVSLQQTPQPSQEVKSQSENLIEYYDDKYEPEHAVMRRSTAIICIIVAVIVSLIIGIAAGYLGHKKISNILAPTPTTEVAQSTEPTE